MSILIRGVDLPTNDSLVIRIFPTGDVADQYGRIDERIKAIEIPPHGDLIDRDALDLEREVELADDWKTAHEIANCVKYAPTVIEADEDVKAYEEAMEEFKKNPKTYTLDEVEAFLEEEGRE